MRVADVAAAAVLLVALLDLPGAEGRLTRAEVLAELGAAAGLCVHLGSSDGGLEIEVAKSGRMLVQGLAEDDATCQSARAAIEASGCYGLASVVPLAGTARLPYRDHLVDRLVVSTWGAWQRRGVQTEEALRVVAPGGVLYLESADGWRSQVKARPATMGDWPTRKNQTQGELISRDADLKAPFELRWMDGTAIGRYAVNVVLGSSQGRYFGITPWDAANVGRAKQEHILTARSAFNGLPLWRRRVSEGDARHGVCAVGDTVFVFPEPTAVAAKTTQVLGLNAATGEPRCKIDLGAKFLAGWGPAGDTVVLALMTTKGNTSPCQILCADARTGATRWIYEQGSWPFLVDRDAIYLIDSRLTALDAATGAVRWQAALPPLGEGTKFSPSKALLCYVEGTTLVVATKDHLAAYATKDGTQRWSVQVPLDAKSVTAAAYNPGPYPWQGGVALGAKRYDLATGKEDGLAPAPFGGRCMPRVVSANYTIGVGPSRFLGILGEPDLKSTIAFAGMDSICSVGVMVANGMMYSGSSFCNCVKGKIEGFPAFGSAGVRMTDADLVAPRPVVTGKNTGKAFDETEDPGSWPIYRHDLRRSAATTSPAPKRLNMLWDRPLASRPGGVVADGWKSRISIGLTAPTVAGGRVFVADAEGHRVMAVSAKNGQTLWSFLAGGRVDTPPTIHHGRCLFGCRDGWVYCLRADDGTLIWRTRAAPAEQFVVAYGQVESAWPVCGSVAIQGDLVVLAAGRSHGVDGGLPFLALRLADGSTAWARNRGYIGDMPVSDGEALFIGGIKVCDEDLPKDRNGRMISAVNETFLLRPKELALHDLLIGPRAGLSEAGMMQAPPWSANPRSHAFVLRGRQGSLISFDETATIVASIGEWTDPKGDQALRESGSVSCWKPDPSEPTPVWTVRQPAGARIHGLVVTREAVVICGQADFRAEKSQVFVRMHARDTGAALAECSFPGAPNWDSLALAGGRLYLSTSDGRLAVLGE
ncbi:hypothetical protein LBMAG53_37350 [Planctomycetota bacterium]|nr:hypothetical protein LBMAG53_37350 [Planctomycetota bacterium]